MMADDLSDIYGTDGTSGSPALPHPGVVGGGLDTVYTRYPDMTPTPPPPTLMNKTYYPGSRPAEGDLGSTLSRVGSEITSTYQNAPDIITPTARQAIANTGWLGRNVLGPAIDVVNTGGRDLTAAGAGATAAAAEILGGGDPALTRDIHAGLQILPIVQATSPAAALFRAPPETYGPSPPARVPINVPSDAAPIVTSLYQKADASGATLKPSVTDGFLTDLDKYQPQTASEKAVAAPDATSSLITRLRNLQNAPLDTVQSVQGVDQLIQKAVADQVRPDGSITPQGREMRQIQQDFRARTFDPDASDVNGDPTGFQALSTATKAYAAQARMQAVQNILNNTEFAPNRSQAIASQVASFLRDGRNTAGWTDDEIASLKQAASSGAVRDWMRTEGSRMAGMLGSFSGIPGGGVVGGFTNFALSYGLRNALENLRVRDLENTMRLQGERVPQPGTMPPQPAIPGTSSLLGIATRYAPLTSLLTNQPSNQ